MRRDSRLSSVLHTLLHLANAKGALTSEKLAMLIATNPVVMRRILGGLREAGIVGSEKGHGGGWTLLRRPADVTLREIYEALGMPTVLAMGHRSESPQCLLEQAVNRAMGGAFEAAEALLLARLGDVTLADLEKDAALHMPPGHVHDQRRKTKTAVN